MYFDKILVISDNILQSKKFQNLLHAKQIFASIKIDWACSVYSNRQQFEAELQQVVTPVNLKNNDEIITICNNYNLVISLHCKQLFPQQLVNTVKCINVHPGYNPYGRGWYPQVFAIINNTIVGATIHEIDEQLDHGKIIDRIEVKTGSWENSYDIYCKILEAEIQLLDKNIEAIINNKYNTFNPEMEGYVYLKKDFDNVCKLNLDNTATLQQHINLLRALTHNNYNNGYFIDEETGKKIYVSIQLQPEVENKQLTHNTAINAF